MIDLGEAQKFSNKLALEVGKFLLQNQDKITIKKFKDRQDIQTDIDLRAEKIVVGALQKRFPNHNIHSEEAGIIKKNSEFTWIIDPLDGSKEYFRGLPDYFVCISLEDEREILLSSIYIPRTNLLYSATKGKGAHENDRKIQVSSQKRLSHAIITCHPPNHKVSEPKFTNVWETMARVAKFSYRLRPHNYDNQYLCYLAKGAFDGYFLLIEQGPKWWDVAPGLVIVKEAGGKVTDRRGKPLKNGNLKEGIIASNGKIHNQLLKILNS